MKTVLALITGVACLAPSAIQPADVAGVWAVAVAGAGDTMPFSLFIGAEGGTLSATLVSPRGQKHPATIAVKGDAVTIRFDTNDPSPVRIVMTGTLEGNAMKGTMDVGGHGTAEWTAARGGPGADTTGGSRIGWAPIWGHVGDIYTRGAPVVGATVVITERLTGTTSTRLTDRAGEFFVESARPGLYGIQVAAPGYGALTNRNFCVTAGQPAVFRAALGPSRRGEDAIPPPMTPSAGERIVYVPRSIPTAATLALSEIEGAMALGRKQRPLKAPGLKSRAVVLPPRWRVAAMTQVADAVGEPFEPAEIPRAFVEQVAWIVARPRSVYLNDGATGPEYLAEVSDIVIRPRGVRTDRDDVPPAWKMYLTNECEVDMLVKVLGRHFDRPALVAAFPMDALAPGATVVLTYSAFAAPRGSLRSISVPRKVERVVIRQEDVDSWR
jgi:hypothetical protein